MAGKKKERKTELIAALDVRDLRSEKSMLDELKGLVTYYKIGISLFTAEGPKAVELVLKNDGQCAVYDERPRKCQRYACDDCRSEGP